MRDKHKVMEILQEECAEVIQAVSKIYRFGLNNSWDGITNKQSLVTEIGDVLALIDILVTETDINISEEEIKEAVYNKKEKLKEFLPRYESE
jgi:NTP pyrophosphatase (non-canonical NTP hydrolase)